MEPGFIDFEKEIQKAIINKQQKEEMDIAINNAMEEQGVSNPKDLELPKQDYKKTGLVKSVRLDGIALTTDNKLTRTEYFQQMNPRNLIYGDMTFTKEEAAYLNANYKRLAIGVNSVVAMRCTGNECAFAGSCPYVQINNAPIGKPCLLEYDLLNYHTQRFMEEFQVDPAQHSELMLVQELAELIIYEMRLSRVLSEPGDALLFSEEISFDKTGNEIKNEKTHWAWELKERVKTRRLKIMESLNATRKQKADYNKPVEGDSTYVAFVTNLRKKIDAISTTEEADFTEDEEKK